MGKGDQTRCDGGRRTAAGTSRAQGKVMWIGCRGGQAIDAARPEAELRRVGLADQNGAGVPQPLDAEFVACGNVVPERQRPIGRAHAFGVREVLDRERKPLQRPNGAPSIAPFVARSRFFVRAGAAYGDEAMQRRIEFVDPRQAGVEEFTRADLASVQGRERVCRAPAPAILRGHLVRLKSSAPAGHGRSERA